MPSVMEREEGKVGWAADWMVIAARDMGGVSLFIWIVRKICGRSVLVIVYEYIHYQVLVL